MTAQHRSHHTSIALFLVAGLTVGLLALLLGTTFADTGSAMGSGSGSGSAMLDAGSAASLPTIDTEDPGGLARGIYDAALAGKYKIGVGFLLMLLVFGLRSDYVLGRVAWFKTRLGGVTIAVVTSVGAVIGLALAADAPIQVGVILNALGTALTAAGAWEWARDLLKAKTA